MVESEIMRFNSWKTWDVILKVVWRQPDRKRVLVDYFAVLRNKDYAPVFRQ